MPALFGLLEEREEAIERLVKIDGVGETVASSFIDGLNGRRVIVEDLAEILTITEAEAVVVVAGPLTGLTFCITGTLGRPRKEIALRIKAGGGKVTTTVSGKLNHLVAGENAGSKLDKANRLGVNVLSEKALDEMLDQYSGSENDAENIGETNPETDTDDESGARQSTLGDY